MPKHYLYDSPPHGEQQDGSKRLELHWARESATVMLGTTSWQGQAGQEAGDREWLEGAPPQPAWAGPLIQLERSTINHLIKQLRAARDQALGKDE